ncbi:alkaline shock response membrane anchor protein AmaP [Tepidanaerobacter syntrophicus]|uniref:Uncharacterized conserved protein YloU, alkaline shock protein (Asp26) family n=1 Tax=Tepidanaerobacter syntrophicus TaxID=224999 RepID=A0A0U9HIY6_9FIRM|nr:alkaline shock response membrane anchor protein AmaP [Tepidanaerobacter syntrophicus]GAQ26123.1 uncharacterized conserved protein YloU, alkaline shock protein (Asp26) family [Tepidanaerobacter syntrophicus]
MNFFDRFLLAIYSLVFSLVSIAVIMFSLKTIRFEYAIAGLTLLYGRTEALATGIVLLLIGIRFLFYSLKSNKKVRETIIKSDELGKIAITLDAVESLVLKVIKDNENIKDSTIIVKRQDKGVSIILKLVVNYDVVIPDIAAELQNTIKNYIETTAGVPVSDIQINITNISNQSKPKASK